MNGLYYFGSLVLQTEYKTIRK